MMKKINIVLCIISFLIFNNINAQVKVKSFIPSKIEVNISKINYADNAISLEIKVLDEFNNIINDYNKIGSGFIIKSDKDIQVIPSKINAENFNNGVIKTNIKIHQKGEYVLQLIEEKYKIIYTSDKITVKSGKPKKIKISTPTKTTAGVPFSTKIFLVDEYNNLVDDYDVYGKGVMLSTDGIENISPDFISAKNFKEGKAEAFVKYNSAENIRILAKEKTFQLNALSDRIAVTSNKPAKIQITAPKIVNVDEQWTIAIEINDIYNNIVKGFSIYKKNIILSASDEREIIPSKISSDKFFEGVGFFKIKVNKTGVFNINAAVEGLNISGASNEIIVKSGKPQILKPEYPSTVIAGQSFDMTLNFYDKYSNKVEHYDAGTIRIQNDFARHNIVILDNNNFKDRGAIVKFFPVKAGEYNINIEQVTNAKKYTFPIKVLPSKLKKFSILVPTQITAGKDFEIFVSSYDEFGNLIDNNSSFINKIFTAKIIGKSSEKEITFTGKDFIDGAAKLKLNYELAEPVFIQIYDEFNNLLGKSKETIIFSDEPIKFLIHSPDKAKAGEEFECRISLVDEKGNYVNNFSQMPMIKISTDKNNKIEPEFIKNPIFVNGQLKIKLKYFVSEQINLKFSTIDNKISGVSNTINVFPAEVSKYIIKSPETVRAGEMFKITIYAIDKYHNIVRYFSTKSLLYLSSTGSGDISPNTISSENFNNGFLDILVKYNLKEKIKIKIQDNINSAYGISKEINILPGEIQKLFVSFDDVIEAGKPFKLQITAKDEYGNLNNKFDKKIETISILNSGSVKLIPDKISTNLLNKGSVEGYFIYPKAEEIEFWARMENQDDGFVRELSYYNLYPENNNEILYFLFNCDFQYSYEKNQELNACFITINNIQKINSLDKKKIIQRSNFIKNITIEKSDKMQENQFFIKIFFNSAIDDFFLEKKSNLLKFYLKSKNIIKENIKRKEPSAKQELLSIQNIYDKIDEGAYKEALDIAEKMLNNTKNIADKNEIMKLKNRLEEIINMLRITK